MTPGRRCTRSQDPCYSPPLPPHRDHSSGTQPLLAPRGIEQRGHLTPDDGSHGLTLKPPRPPRPMAVRRPCTTTTSSADSRRAPPQHGAACSFGCGPESGRRFRWPSTTSSLRIAQPDPVDLHPARNKALEPTDCRLHRRGTTPTDPEAYTPPTALRDRRKVPPTSPLSQPEGESA